ncbi:MAG: hypothetical protein AAB075_08165 [Gemmatimonadota bacterium]
MTEGGGTRGKGLERRYTEEEVARILKESAQGGESTGLTLRQLEEIGREVGISPAAIRAAATRSPAPHGSKSGLFGAPAVTQQERLLPGPVRADQREGLLLAIRRAMGRHGVATQSDTGVEWKARDALGGRYVTVQTAGDETVVRGFGNFRDGIAFATMFTGAVTFFVSLGLIKLYGVLGLGAAPMVGLAAWLPAQFFWRRRFAAEQRALDAAVNDASQYLEATSQEPKALPGD